jgi:integrase
VAAGLGPPCEHALISLLALNGLRVSEATGADIEDLGQERGHRTLTITRKGGKVVTIPLAPRTTMRYDRARGSLDRHATYIVAAYVAGAAGSSQGLGDSSAWPPQPPGGSSRP